MAGYIGSKTVNLSTTGADIAGDADVSGALDVGGGLTVDNDGSTVLTVDRATSDGTIIDVQKSGSSVGSMGAYNSATYIQSGSAGSYTGIYLNTNKIEPVGDSSGNIRTDATVDLGSTANRFKDLYLSGGVYLGGTGAANKLDDYEEGTWTPAITAGSGGSSIVSGTNTATYTKIGRLVFCQIRTNCSSSSTSRLHISSLPFTNAGGNAQLGVMSKHGTNGGSFYALSAGEFAAYSYDGGIFTAADASGVFRASFTYHTS